MNARTSRTATAIVLEIAALALLLAVVLGHPWPSERRAIPVYVLADRSASVAGESRDTAVTAVVAHAKAAAVATEVRTVDFAGEAATPRRADSAARAGDAPGDLDTGSTDIEAAVGRVLESRDPEVPAAIVLVSDGNATNGDTARALRSAAESGAAVFWQPVPPRDDRPRIVDVTAPLTARPGQSVPVSVRVAGSGDRPLRLVVGSRSGNVDAVSTELPSGALASATLNLKAATSGALVLDAALVDAAGSQVDAWRDAAAVDVEPPARLLYVASGATAYARSLIAGGWSVELLAPSGLDARAAGLGGYSAIVLDDVPAAAARPATWSALASAVGEDGTGLLVLGGARSFASGGYRDSPLDSLLPVHSSPSALGDAAAIAFVVDKSGSMGETSAGVDRFRLAQRAVVETAATLTARDSASLVAFDVEARELLPLQPAAGFQAAVAKPWPAQPRGGTRLGPAIDAALGPLESSDAPRRVLVLVTDGFVNEAAESTLRARLQQARVELVALAVGPDADVAALEALFPPERSTILRVGEAAELPTMMRQGLEARRAPIERGRIAVRERAPLPFMHGLAGAWPDAAACDVTTPAKDAVVYLESGRGDPVFAQRQQGLGRVVALTTGIGEWTPDWLRWQRWPAFAGGLADWVSSARTASAAGAPSLRVTDRPGSLDVEVDSARDGRWSEVDGRVRIEHPTGRTEERSLVPAGPGRAGIEIDSPEAGLYAIRVETPAGAARALHLQQPGRELAAAGINPEIADWQRTGLVQAWSPTAFDTAVGAMHADDRRPSRAILLALALFVLGLLVDRADLSPKGRSAQNGS